MSGFKLSSLLIPFIDGSLNLIQLTPSIFSTTCECTGCFFIFLAPVLSQHWEEPTPTAPSPTPAPVPVPVPPTPVLALLQLQYFRARSRLIEVIAPLHVVDFLSLLQEQLLLQYFIDSPTLILATTVSLIQPPYFMLLLQHFLPQHPSDQVRLNALNCFAFSLQVTYPHLLLFLHALLHVFAPL